VHPYPGLRTPERLSAARKWLALVSVRGLKDTKIVRLPVLREKGTFRREAGASLTHAQRGLRGVRSAPDLTYGHLPTNTRQPDIICPRFAFSVRIRALQTVGPLANDNENKPSGAEKAKPHVPARIMGSLASLKTNLRNA
jgi:hypothetical protein